MRQITLDNNTYEFLKLFLERDDVQKIGFLYGEENITKAYEAFHKKGKAK